MSQATNPHAGSRRTVEMSYLGQTCPYVFGDGIVDEVGDGVHAYDARVTRTVLIADDRVFAAHGDRIVTGLEKRDLRTQVHTVTTSNPDKTLAAVERLYEVFHDFAIDGRTFLLLLGGNVLTDCAAYACATYVRGVPFGLLPSTLLAQVDGSLGGALGVHYRGITNGVGLRKLPELVWSDPALLDTLPKPELVAGFAEIVKQAVVSNGAMFERLATLSPEDLANPSSRAEIIWDAVTAKCELLTRTDDWRLNFGHTLGHALESATGHAALRHGEAVSIGMAFESGLAAGIGLMSGADRRRVTDLLARFGLPLDLAGTNLRAELVNPASRAALRARIMHFITRDKKVRDGAVRWWLPSRIGAAERHVVPQDVYATYLDELLALP